MRKPNNANKFKTKLAKREAKVKALNALGTPEARKERKNMDVHWHGKLVPTNVRGFYAGKHGHGGHPVKVKINARNRRTLAAMKAIMRLSAY